jgi:RNA polymerase sigma-70 factor (ECF subfamily)
MVEEKKETRWKDWPSWSAQERYQCLIQQFYKPLYRYLSHWFPLQEDREDCLQEVYYTLFRKMDLYNPSKPLTPWVYALARNQALSLLRKKGRVQEVYLEPQDISLLAEDDQRDLVFPLEWAQVMGKLRIPEKELAHFRFTLELPLIEIAKLLGIPLGTVKSRLSSLKAKLRQLLSKEDSYV